MSHTMCVMGVSLTSLSQNLNTASKIDIVLPTSQNQDSTNLPRMPGAGKEQILHVSPDFDAALDLGPRNV